MSEPFQKLAAKLSELFELEKADLDFGIHRIIKARQKHIRIFLGLEKAPAEDPGAPTLEKIVRREMGALNTVELERQLTSAAGKITTNYGKLAFTDTGALAAGAAADSPDGQQWLSLREQLDSGAEKANAQLEAEIYSHLTEFFSRYYDEADFLSKRRIKAGDAPYAVPYSGEEVMLHWANKDQYYIKSSKDLKDYTFTLPEQFGKRRVQFKCERQDPVLNNNNAKREFHLDDEAEILLTPDTLLIPFHFKIVEKTRTQAEAKEWTASILSTLTPEWHEALTHTPAGAKNNLITRHLTNYTRKNEADFFIHKHLGKFLRGELDFYIKNEVMHLDDIDTKSTDYLATRVRLIKALRTIARHLITFLAQLENFQKKIWLKKKYVTESQYCLTLDRIFALKSAETLTTAILGGIDTKILRYDGEMRSQKDEWIKLYAIHELPDFPKDGKLTAKFLQDHDKLMLDTVFFPQSIKWNILGEIGNIDESLDGLIIHSENFQALNLLQERYRGEVKCVYIDPPYNTGNDGFVYKDRYQKSSWMTAIEERIREHKKLNSDSGVTFISIDNNESSRLRSLANRVFSEENFKAHIIWQKRYTRSNNTQDFTTTLESILCFSKSSDFVVPLLPRTNEADDRYSNPDNDPSGAWKGSSFLNPATPSERPNLCYEITNPNTGRTRFPTTNAWRRSREEFDRLNLEGKLYWGADGTAEVPSIKMFLSQARGLTPIDFWSHSYAGNTDEGTKDLEEIFNQKVFQNPKPIKLVQKIIQHSSEEKSTTTLDYFAGSGTTAHAVINLNREDSGTRRYILVEMGDHFDTVLKPRIQKVVYSKDWKEGKPVRAKNDELGMENFSGISHAFKYLRLESYEDALNNLDLGGDRAADLLGLGDGVREDYLFSYLLDVETRGHLMNLDRFRDPWGCQLKIHDPHSGKSEAKVVDLIETFNYLMGLTIQEMKVKDGFLAIEATSPAGDNVLVIWRKIAGDSDWQATSNEELKQFIATRRINLADTEYHAIYINGDHTLTDPQSKIHCIEEVFYERMFENTGSPED